MTFPRFGYNVLKLDNPGRERLWRHADVLPPGAMLFYNTEGEAAWDFKRDFPAWTVIHRSWPDGHEWETMTPDKWLERHEHRGRDGVLIYTCNEPMWTPRLLNWHTDLIKIARAGDARFLVLGLSPGHPEPIDWYSGESQRLLGEMAKDGSRHFMNLHEYGGGLMTSGIPGYATPGPIQPEQWPLDLDHPFKPTWHVGRWRYLRKACQEMGIPMPPVIISEMGIAELGDIDQWIKSLRFTPGYISHAGWQAMRTQWEEWYRAKGWSAEKAYAEMVLYALAILWGGTGDGIHSALMFGWGDSGGWTVDDISNAPIFHNLMELRLKQLTPAPLPPPAPDGHSVTLDFEPGQLESIRQSLTDLLDKLGAGLS